MIDRALASERSNAQSRVIAGKDPRQRQALLDVACPHHTTALDSRRYAWFTRTMTKSELIAALRADDGEYLEFERIAKKRSGRPDLHAFLLLDELLPGSDDMIVAAEHDEIYLSVGTEALAAVATPDLVTELRRCGVMVSDDNEGLMMFA